jgi:hypothetical protein
MLVVLSTLFMALKGVPKLEGRLPTMTAMSWLML